MLTNLKSQAIIPIVIVALLSSSFSSLPKTESSSISFYCKWKVRYQENSGYNTKTFYFITDVKTIEGNNECINYRIGSDLNDKMYEQVRYNFPDLVKTPDRWHDMDGGRLRIEVITDESKNEVERLRRNDISSIRDKMKADDKLNSFIFDLDDLSCE